MSNKMERRFLHATEVRAEQEDGKKVLSGYAAKFNKLSENLGGFREAIKPGAFSRAIKEKQDVRMLINHDPNLPVGRTGKNLTLAEDKTGLKFRVALPDTQMARDLYENVRNGIMSQCSFGFIPRSETWTNMRDGGYEAVQYEGVEDKQAVVRELNDLDLMDVSAVTYPAYEDTEVNARNGQLTAVEIRSLFPDGIPEEVAKHMAEAIKPAEERKVKYLVTEDDGTTHLPVTGDDGKPDHKLMGAAWAALHGGYRGNKYEGPGKADAIAKLKKMYESEGMDTPDEQKAASPEWEKRHDTIHDIGGLLPKIQEAMKSFGECSNELLDAIDSQDMDAYDKGTEAIAPDIKALSALLDALEKAVDKENTEEEDTTRHLLLKQLQVAAQL